MVVNAHGSTPHEGYGNHMFQHAATIGLATHNNIPWGRLHDFNLCDSFKLESTKKVTDEDCKGLPIKGEHNFHFGESPYGPDFFQWDVPTIIQGFFQSEKHFSHCRDVVRKEFTFKDHIMDQATIERSNYGNPLVSVNVRRGDYLNNKELYSILDIDYYDKAISTIKDKLNREFNLLYFSNDPKWVNENLIPTHGGNLSPGCEDLQELEIDNDRTFADQALMSKCDHHIIGNSTYGWWGAWLGENPNKIVISPSSWFSNSINTNDVHCPGWIVI